MSDAEQLAAKWQAEIDRLEQSIDHLEQGTLRMIHNGVDVSPEHAAAQRQMVDNLREAIPVLLRGGQTRL